MWSTAASTWLQHRRLLHHPCDFDSDKYCSNSRLWPWRLLLQLRDLDIWWTLPQQKDSDMGLLLQQPKGFEDGVVLLQQQGLGNGDYYSSTGLWQLWPLRQTGLPQWRHYKRHRTSTVMTGATATGFPKLLWQPQQTDKWRNWGKLRTSKPNDFT